MSEKQIAGFFGASLKVRGTLTGKGDLVVEGRLDGEMRTLGSLAIAQTGVVHADVSVTTLDVNGELVGDVQATQAVRIASGGRIDGDVRAASIAIDDGAELNGGIEMDFEMPDDELIPS